MVAISKTVPNRMKELNRLLLYLKRKMIRQRNNEEVRIWNIKIALVLSYQKIALAVSKGLMVNIFKRVVPEEKIAPKIEIPKLITNNLKEIGIVLLIFEPNRSLREIETFGSKKEAKKKLRMKPNRPQITAKITISNTIKEEINLVDIPMFLKFFSKPFLCSYAKFTVEYTINKPTK